MTNRLESLGQLCSLCCLAVCLLIGFDSIALASDVPDIDPTQVLWYRQPADKWENALPVGNGRLGAMVFGKTDEEIIQFNEETYWSGGPYSTTVTGGSKHLSDIQRLVFEGQYYQAHRLFGKYLMGYPVEQQKYQSTGDLILKFAAQGDVTNYVHQLDLARAISTVRYEQGGVQYRREVFSTPIHQVIVVRLTADKPQAISLTANLHGYRNTAHSNYATDYYHIDGYGPDSLILRGKSADYLGVEGKLRYQARVKAVAEGGIATVDDVNLIVEKADAVTFYIAAATNFVNYRDVSADADQRIEAVLANLHGMSYQTLREQHVQAHQSLLQRISIDLGSSPQSLLPTDQRISQFDGTNDANLAALCFQYGRYLLICSSRPGTQPANLQGIWNNKMNPSWDSKYTTNINTQMNYWPAEVGNLSELTEPLFTMIEQLTDQGADVAREHYGKTGWVFHQNTDLWRVAAPMDGVQWGTFTTGGAWLCTHLWEHYLYTRDKAFLRKAYPVMKGSVEFFLDFLVEHPRHGWLVTNPSTSPENFPGRPGNVRFKDDIPDYYSPGTTICAGSTIDLQILSDLFSYTAEAAKILGIDADFQQRIAATHARFAPLHIGQAGDLQEWLEDWPQKEESHRHISHLYGLFPGNQISARRTPQLAEGARVVLNQRGLTGNGWSSAWKMACWARLYEPDKALANFHYYIRHYVTASLFALCSDALQVDGAFGVTAAISEMLLQSHEGQLHLLPALPQAWSSGKVSGLCARGGFTIDMQWSNGKLVSVTILSKLGETIPIRYRDREIVLTTEAGKRYRLDGQLNKF